jgi:hypothetical protein
MQSVEKIALETPDATAAAVNALITGLVQFFSQLESEATQKSEAAQKEFNRFTGALQQAGSSPPKALRDAQQAAQSRVQAFQDSAEKCASAASSMIASLYPKKN